MDKLLKSIFILILVIFSLVALNLFSEPTASSSGGHALYTIEGEHKNIGAELEELGGAFMDWNSSLADVAVEMQVSIWEDAPLAGRCLLGLVYQVLGILILTGFVTISAGLGLWRRFIE